MSKQQAAESGTAPRTWQVRSVPEFGLWLHKQNATVQKRLAALILVLQQDGPRMGPEGSRRIVGNHPISLRELRIKTPAIRVLYTFDQDRSAVLLYGGDKTGDWADWYPKAIREACSRFQS